MALEKQAQDLASEMNDLRESLQGLGKTAKDKETALKQFGDALGAGAVNVSKSLGAFTLAVGKGDTSFSSLTAVVDVVTNAVSAMAKAVPVAGGVMSAAVKAGGEAAKFLLTQLDETAKGFNAMSAAGALTGTGMTGLMDQSLRSGIPLKAFTRVVAENGKTLAGWTGVTGSGAEEFSKVVGSFTQGQDNSLRLLGMNAEQIADTTAAYLTQQVRFGTAQNRSTAELTTGAKKYSLELDQLQKITGMSAKSIQKQQDEMMSNSRFRANIQEMVDKGHEDLAKAVQDTQTQMAGLGPTIGKGFADLVSGSADTAEAAKLTASTGGAAMDIVDRLKTGKITQEQANTEMLDAMEKQADYQQKNAQTVDSATSAFLPNAELADAIASRQKGAREKAVATQNKQLSGQDQLTADVVTAQKELEKFNLQIQEMARDYMPLAADATKMLADSIKEFIEYSSKTLGLAQEGKPMSGTAGAAAGAASLGLAGAAIGSVIPGVGTVIGGAIGAVVGGVAGSLGMIDYGVAGPDKKGTGSTAPTDGDATGTESAFAGGAGAPVGPEQSNTAVASTTGDVAAARGTILSGPASGYRPGASMTGIESKPLTAANLNNEAGTSIDIDDIVGKQLTQLDELISSARTQLSVKEKMLKFKA